MSTTHDMHDTQAAEPILDATAPAPTEDETQSIYAWSQYDSDDDTITFQRRSWKLPVAAALIAVAGLTAGAITVWPHHSTPRTPAVAAAPPAVMPTPTPAYNPNPDARFIDLYQQRGYHENQPGQTKSMIDVAHQICLARDANQPQSQIVHDVLADNSENTPDHPAMLPGQADLLVQTAIDAMCPSAGS